MEIEISIWKIDIPINKNLIIPPKGIKLSDENFIKALDNFNQALKPPRRIICDNYYIDETLTKRVQDRSHCIMGIVAEGFQFYLRIGIFRQTESGRMMRYFMKNKQMKVIAQSKWNRKTGELLGLMFSFVRKKEER